MSYEVKVTGETLAELASNLIKIAGQFGATPAEAPKEANAKVDKPKETVPKESTKTSETAEISYAKDVAPRVLKLAIAKGRTAALELLAKFKVEKAPQLTADQYPAFIAAADAAIAAE
jgi:hypothetical protein